MRSGTGGGIFVFKDRIMEDNPEFIFLLHSDVICSFPLDQIREFHKKHGQFATIMGTKIEKEYATHFGCIVADEENNVVHYAEKPSSFINNLINAGVYCFSKSLIEEVEKVREKSTTE